MHRWKLAGPTMKYIWHVALGPGIATKEPCQYSGSQLAAWFGHISSALAAQAGAAIPGQPGYRMTARQIGGTLLCTVGRSNDKTPLVTFCVVERATQARKAWEGLHEGYPQFAASKSKTPQAPYCAVRAESGLPFDQSSAQWLDPYQIVIAWAWLTRDKTNA